MIQEIFVSGFQSLVDVRLELGKLTVIVGNTNQGKSALFRALRVMIENRRGDGVINDDSAQCGLSVMTDTSVVGWSKKRTKSGEYLYNNVPCSQAKAIEALKINEVALTKQLSIWPNFQDQMASPFLLAETDSQKSKVLGEITNANLLLLSASEVKKKQNDVSNKLAWRQSDYTTAKYSLEKVEYVPAVIEQLHIIKSNLTVLNSWLIYLAKLEDIYARLSEIVNEINRLTRKGDFLKEYRAKLEAAWPNDILFERLKLFYSRLEQIETDIIYASKVKKKLDLASRLPEMGDIERRMFDIAKLEGFVLAIQDQQQIESVSSTEREKAKKELLDIDDEIDKLKKFAEFCPLCEQPMELNAHISHE